MSLCFNFCPSAALLKSCMRQVAFRVRNLHCSDFIQFSCSRCFLKTKPSVVIPFYLDIYFLFIRSKLLLSCQLSCFLVVLKLVRKEKKKPEQSFRYTDSLPLVVTAPVRIICCCLGNFMMQLGEHLESSVPLNSYLFFVFLYFFVFFSFCISIVIAHRNMLNLYFLLSYGRSVLRKQCLPTTIVSVITSPEKHY